MGDGILFDISNPEAPRVINRVRDTVNFAFWHSATFNNAGTKVVFTDELGGGGGATCNATVGPNRGADAIYDIVGRGDSRTLVFRSYFKIPRTNTDTENCVAHNGSLIPVQGRDIMVQAWYQGGISVWDFTDSAQPGRDRLLGARAALGHRARSSAAPGRRTATTATSTPTTSRRALTSCRSTTAARTAPTVRASTCSTCRPSRPTATGNPGNQSRGPGLPCGGRALSLRPATGGPVAEPGRGVLSFR